MLFLGFRISYQFSVTVNKSQFISLRRRRNSRNGFKKDKNKNVIDVPVMRA